MFGIDEQKIITYDPDGEPPGSVGVWDTKAQFAYLAQGQGWSKADVSGIWNANVGRPPFGDLGLVKMFRNRPYGIDRIWEAIQRLKIAPSHTANGQAATDRLSHHRVAKANRSRGDSKRDEAIRLLGRTGGVSGRELQDTFGWQPHTVRGFLSTLASKHGIKITARKDEIRGRVYQTSP